VHYDLEFADGAPGVLIHRGLVPVMAFAFCNVLLYLQLKSRNFREWQSSLQLAHHLASFHVLFSWDNESESWRNTNSDGFMIVTWPLKTHLLSLQFLGHIQ
jgi:hypothetical protein